MRILFVHNEYGRISGEEVVIENLIALLTSKGQEVQRFFRTSAAISATRLGTIRAFFSGIYNPFSRAAFGRLLSENRPDVVHVHNVFPLISPSILPECRRRGIPVVMTLHNFRLVCPNALLLRDGKVCHKCLGGREIHCVLNNCERSLGRSVGYAARTAFARHSRIFLDDVNQFVCLTEFQREIHLREGFPSARCTVIPNAVPTRFLQDENQTNETDADRNAALEDDLPVPFVGYVGRISPEKDLASLLEAARLLPQIPFVVAGSALRMPDLQKSAPANVRFLGQLERDRLKAFYGRMRLLVFATKCYEGCPTTLLEAMACGVPVVCARIGGLPEIVEDGRSGLLYEPGNSQDLARKVQMLWDNPDMRRAYRQFASSKAVQDYHPDTIYRKYAGVYAAALQHPLPVTHE